MRAMIGLVFCAVAASGCLRGGDIGTVLVASGFSSPIFLTAAPGVASSLYVLEQRTGLIRIVEDGEILETPFLDIGAKVSDAGGERGLFSMAFHPDFANNGTFFVCYSDNDDATVVERYTVSLTNKGVADPNSGSIILTVPQPFSNHNGGMIAFSPIDGYLYVALGDGGGPVNAGNNPAQNMGSLLGSILRIDVDSAEPYAIPPDNPFVGVDDAAEEIWAYGLRNPWRFSFDRDTGDMWIGDVGQNAREEINYEPPTSPGGNNYGWPIAEGFACLGGDGDCGSDPGLTPPVYDYTLPRSQSVTGGYVYRGESVPSAEGKYFFADFIENSIWTLEPNGDGFSEEEQTDALAPIGLEFGGIASFGEDGDGELYIIDLGGGRVYQVVQIAVN